MIARRRARLLHPNTCAAVFDSVGVLMSSHRSQDLAHSSDTFLALVVAWPSADCARVTSDQFNNGYASGKERYELATSQ